MSGCLKRIIGSPVQESKRQRSVDYDSDCSTISEWAGESADETGWIETKGQRFLESVGEEIDRDSAFQYAVCSSGDIFVENIEKGLCEIIRCSSSKQSIKGIYGDKDDKVLLELGRLVYNAFWLNDAVVNGDTVSLTDSDVEYLSSRILDIVKVKVEENVNNNFF